MKKFIFILLFVSLGTSVCVAQSNSTLIKKHREFKNLEIEQYDKEQALQKSLIRYHTENKVTGQEIASDYIEFAQKAIERWKVALENPEVLFLEMETLEVVEMIKSHTENHLDPGERVEKLKEDLRIKIREHIQKLSDDIRELSS